MQEHQDQAEANARREAADALLALFATVVAMFAVSAVAVLVAAKLAGVDRSDPVQAAEFAVALPFLFALLVGSQLFPAGSALLFARRSSRPLAERLGLGPGRLRPATAVCLAAGSLCISWPLEHLLVALGVEAGPNLDGIVGAVQAHPVFAAVAFSLFPGVCEELFFRGLVQRGLERAVPAVVAILFPALVFGFVHLDPLQSPVAAALGAWFGFLAWRSGSIRVAIGAHLLNNLVVALALGHTELEGEGYAEFLTHPTFTAIGVVSALFLVAGLWLLARENRASG